MSSKFRERLYDLINLKELMTQCQLQDGSVPDEYLQAYGEMLIEFIKLYEPGNEKHWEF